MIIGFIGTGKIASAVVEAICTSTLLDYEVFLSPRSEEKSIALAEKFEKVSRLSSNQDVLDKSEIIFIALRPADYKNVLSELTFKKDHTLISLIPFLGIIELAELVAPATKLSRAIPLPTIVNHVCPVPIFKPSEKVLELFSKIAQAFVVNSEVELHTIWTLTSLISPYYDLMNTMSEWSVENGLSKVQADKYVADMFHSLAKAASISSNPDFNALSHHAATPGGLNEKTALNIAHSGAHKTYSGAADMVLQMFAEVTRE